MLQDWVEQRLATVPAIAGRILGALSYAQLRDANQLPQVAPGAFVLPLGLVGGAAPDVSGLFVQSVQRVVGVLLVVRHAGDATGGAGGVQLEPLIEDVIAAITGDAPAGAIGVFELDEGKLLSAAAGTLVYQLAFRINDQLRIAR